MGLRRDRKVSGWETGLTFAGELDIMREIFTQQGVEGLTESGRETNLASQGTT